MYGKDHGLKMPGDQVPANLTKLFLQILCDNKLEFFTISGCYYILKAASHPRMQILDNAEKA
jgi:hypothetical protein